MQCGLSVIHGLAMTLSSLTVWPARLDTWHQPVQEILSYITTSQKVWARSRR